MEATRAAAELGSAVEATLRSELAEARDLALQAHRNASSVAEGADRALTALEERIAALAATNAQHVAREQAAAAQRGGGITAIERSRGLELAAADKGGITLQRELRLVAAIERSRGRELAAAEKGNVALQRDLRLVASTFARRATPRSAARAVERSVERSEARSEERSAASPARAAARSAWAAQSDRLSTLAASARSTAARASAANVPWNAPRSDPRAASARSSAARAAAAAPIPLPSAAPPPPHRGEGGRGGDGGVKGRGGAIVRPTWSVRAKEEAQRRRVSVFERALIAEVKGERWDA